jgi:hypothetical protein
MMPYVPPSLTEPCDTVIERVSAIVVRIPSLPEFPDAEQHHEDRSDFDITGWASYWGSLGPAATGAIVPGDDASVTQPLDVVERQPRRNGEFSKAAISTHVDRHSLGKRWRASIPQPKLQRTTVHRYAGIRPARSTRHY